MSVHKSHSTEIHVLTTLQGLTLLPPCRPCFPDWANPPGAWGPRGLSSAGIRVHGPGSRSHRSLSPTHLTPGRSACGQNTYGRQVVSSGLKKAVSPAPPRPTAGLAVQTRSAFLDLQHEDVSCGGGQQVPPRPETVPDTPLGDRMG